MGRQFLFNTDIKVAGIVVLWARAGGVVQGRGRIARLCGGWWPGQWAVVPVVVPGVAGGRGVAVVGGLRHPSALKHWVNIVQLKT